MLNDHLENPFTIMLAQLKTVVLIKEAIKLAFRVVEYLEHALFCVGSSTQRCIRSSVSWLFLAWNSHHFSE
jgi:hypothetical protein